MAKVVFLSILLFSTNVLSQEELGKDAEKTREVANIDADNVGASEVDNAKKIKDIGRSLRILRAKLVNAENEAKISNDAFNEGNKALIALDTEIKTLDKSIVSENLELSKIEKRISNLSFQMDDVKAQIHDKKLALRQRIIGMYKTRRGLPALSFIMASENVHSIYRRASYIQRLLEKDGNQLVEFENLIETLKSGISEMSRLRHEEEGSKVLLQTKKEELTKKKIEEAKRVRDLKVLLEKREVTLTSLKKQEEDFENTIRELTGGNIEESSNINIPIPSVIESGITNPENSALKVGGLLLPVSGSIIQHFGKHKHEDFKEMVQTKGVEFTCPISSDIKAVLPGKVVFNSELASYGNVVILEHDNRLFSLYGRIISSVSIGQEVTAGNTLGKSSAPDEKGRNFYFELRKSGSPLDPEKYFAKK